MFPIELKDLIFQVVKSWQVLAVIIALVLYIYMVNYVSRAYHRPRLSKTKAKRAKKEAAAKPEENPDELNLE